MIKALKKKLKQILFKHDISFITIQLFNGNVSVITIGLYLSEFYKLKYEVNMQVLHYNNLIRAKPKNSPLDDEDYWDIILPLAQEIINLNKKTFKLDKYKNYNELSILKNRFNPFL